MACGRDHPSRTDGKIFCGEAASLRRIYHRARFTRMIVSIPKGKYTAVQFIENSKPVKTVEIGKK